MVQGMVQACFCWTSSIQIVSETNSCKRMQEGETKWNKCLSFQSILKHRKSLQSTTFAVGHLAVQVCLRAALEAEEDEVVMNLLERSACCYFCMTNERKPLKWMVDVCQSGSFYVASSEASFSRDFIGTALCSGTHWPGGCAVVCQRIFLQI